MSRRGLSLGGLSSREETKEYDQGAESQEDESAEVGVDHVLALRGHAKADEFAFGLVAHVVLLVLEEDEVHPDGHRAESEQLEEPLQHGLNIPRA